MERHGKGQIGEGGCEETFLCLSLKKEKCRFKVPPAVSLLHYISSGILWRIFCQTGIFAGFSQSIINFPVRIRETTMGGAGNIIFHSLDRKLSIVYRVPQFLFSRLIWNHAPTRVGKLFVQGIERRGGGVSHFPGKAVGGPKSYDSTETVVLCIHSI